MVKAGLNSLSKGVYTLLIELGNDKVINLRSRAHYYFTKGYYIYNGSAFGEGSASLEKRIVRHLTTKKKRFWHIDHLLDGDAWVLVVIYSPTKSKMECEVNRKISLMLSAQPIKGFGSSDCKAGCLGHLLQLKEKSKESVMDTLYKAYLALGLEPRDLGMRI